MAIQASETNSPRADTVFLIVRGYFYSFATCVEGRRSLDFLAISSFSFFLFLSCFVLSQLALGLTLRIGRHKKKLLY
jgi:hypothetical protein